MLVAVDQLPEKFQPLDGPALDLEQRLAVHPMAARLIKGEDRKPVQHVLRHHVFAEIRHVLHEVEIIRFGLPADLFRLLRVHLPAVPLARLGVFRCCVSSFHLVSPFPFLQPLTGSAGSPPRRGIRGGRADRGPCRRRWCSRICSRSRRSLSVPAARGSAPSIHSPRCRARA